ncbi:MAG: class I SAM-dependent methyltransferase [Calditrichaeota bacterium]|nr:MAG: class I SAM-dependent methyltransferase [Calditrichota bacterium]
MKQIDNKSTVHSRAEYKDWFKKAFRDDYLLLYSHHDDAEATANIKLAINHVPFSEGHSILDIACGTGRHLQAFAQLGAEVTGIDISDTMLMQARRRFDKVQLPVQLAKHDMRNLPFNEQFDGVTMWFTSFGYFENADQDRLVLDNIYKVLKSDGWWWIDLVNPQFLTNSLVPRTERKIKGPNGKASVKEKRYIVGDRVEKMIEITDDEGKRKYTESVRLYEPESFSQLLMACGLVPEGVLGDYDGSALAPTTPRQIWYGRKQVLPTERAHAVFLAD